MTMESWTDPNGSADQPWASAVVATCGQLSKLVRHSDGCVDGKVMRLSDPNAGTGQGRALVTLSPSAIRRAVPARP